MKAVKAMLNKKKTIGNNLSLWLPLCMGVTNIKNLLYVSSAILPYKDIINVIVGLFILFAFLASFKTFQKYRDLYLFSAVYFLIIASNILLRPNNTKFILDKLLSTIMFGYMTFMLTYAADDYKPLFSNHVKVCRVVIIVAILMFVTTINQIKSNEYNMSFGYATVTAVVFCGFNYFKEKKAIDLVLAFLATVCIVLFGSRGPLCCIATAFVICVGIEHKKITLKTAALFVLIILLCVIVILNLRSIVGGILDMVDNLGIESRTIRLLLDGEITQGSGRSWVYEVNRRMILEHPFLGIGIEGLQAQGYINWTPHNTYYEMLLTYGVPLGVLVILLLVLIWSAPFFHVPDEDLRRLCFIFFALYVPTSFFGGDSMANTRFWALLAYGIKCWKARNRKKIGEVRAIGLNEGELK